VLVNCYIMSHPFGKRQSQDFSPSKKTGSRVCALKHCRMVANVKGMVGGGGLGYRKMGERLTSWASLQQDHHGYHFLVFLLSLHSYLASWVSLADFCRNWGTERQNYLVREMWVGSYRIWTQVYWSPKPTHLKGKGVEMKPRRMSVLRKKGFIVWALE
jgi:hypothetical protein